MYELTQEDRVWNRACSLTSASPRPGDRALRMAVLADGLANNGGVLHCVEVLAKSGELQDAMEAYEYFGLPKAAELLARAHGVPKSDASADEASLDREYAQILEGNALQAQFKEHYASHPEAYEPI